MELFDPFSIGVKADVVSEVITMKKLLAVWLVIIFTGSIVSCTDKKGDNGIDNRKTAPVVDEVVEDPHKKLNGRWRTEYESHSITITINFDDHTYGSDVPGTIPVGLYLVSEEKDTVVFSLESSDGMLNENIKCKIKDDDTIIMKGKDGKPIWFKRVE